MKNITIDGRDYDIESLSDAAKSELQMIQICDHELTRLNTKLAIFQTARLAYVKALQANLPRMPEGDTIKLSW